MADHAVTTEVLEDNPGRQLTAGSLIKVGERYYPTKVFIPKNFKIGEGLDTSNLENVEVFKIADSVPEFSPNVAYLIDDYYYLFRGNLKDLKGFDPILPGIYYDENAQSYVIRHPETEEEKKEYYYGDKITTYDIDEIRKAVLNHDVIIFNMPDSVRSTIPPEQMNEDMLKRITKRALLAKGIDLDQCRARFASKNMLFNFKSVIRGDNRLSMMLFERGMDALNLKFTIIVEEAGGEQVGHCLDDPIIISSDEVFETGFSGNFSGSLSEEDES